MPLFDNCFDEFPLLVKESSSLRLCSLLAAWNFESYDLCWVIGIITSNYVGLIFSMIVALWWALASSFSTSMMAFLLFLFFARPWLELESVSLWLFFSLLLKSIWTSWVPKKEVFCWNNCLPNSRLLLWWCSFLLV